MRERASLPGASPGAGLSEATRGSERQSFWKQRGEGPGPEQRRLEELTSSSRTEQKELFACFRPKTSTSDVAVPA